jgi:hypothetical protein
VLDHFDLPWCLHRSSKTQPLKSYTQTLQVISLALILSLLMKIRPLLSEVFMTSTCIPILDKSFCW